MLRCLVLCCIAFHCIALHCTALHCIVLDAGKFGISVVRHSVIQWVLCDVKILNVSTFSMLARHMGQTHEPYITNASIHAYMTNGVVLMGALPDSRFMGPTWDPLGGGRWVPCWPHEPCYLGIAYLVRICNKFYTYCLLLHCHIRWLTNNIT